MILDIVYIGDGYLVAASLQEDSLGDLAYFPHEIRYDESVELITVEITDDTLVEQLLAQGTSEQDFSDGYDAAGALACYAIENGIDLGE